MSWRRHAARIGGKSAAISKNWKLLRISRSSWRACFFKKNNKKFICSLKNSLQIYLPLCFEFRNWNKTAIKPPRFLGVFIYLFNLVATGPRNCGLAFLISSRRQDWRYSNDKNVIIRTPLVRVRGHTRTETGSNEHDVCFNRTKRHLWRLGDSFTHPVRLITALQISKVSQTIFFPALSKLSLTLNYSYYYYYYTIIDVLASSLRNL